jgi:replication factor A2
MSDSRAGYYESPSKTFSPTQGSQDGNKKRNQPLYPVSIKQLHSAQQVTPDADDFTLNNQPLAQICLIGQIVDSQPTQTHHNYKVDDSTGTIDVRSWVDQEAPHRAQQAWNAGDYVRVIGNLRSFGEKRYVVSTAQLLPIVDFNEITHHFLEIIHLTLTLSGKRSKGLSNTMEVTPNAYTRQPAINNNNHNNNNNNNNNNNSLNSLQADITQLVFQNNQNGDGINIDLIVQNFVGEHDESEVRNTIAFLIDEGHLYNTTDSNHVGATDEC